MNKWWGIAFLFFCMSPCLAQVGYQQDSLQIKVYTVITYENSHPNIINVSKVFCDYCSKKQLQHIERRAWNMTYDARYAPENRIQEGERKLALFIRISKKDFSKLKDEERKSR